MITQEDGNIEIRQAWDAESNVMQVFGEAKVVSDLVPDDFKTLFENYETHAVEANATVKAAYKIGTDEGVDTIKSVVNAPWPVSERVMFCTRYLDLDQDGSHMILSSSDGN